MQRLGLALSGGGFRATIYHLGVLRFLRDSGLLPKITHINTVSGGSIIGAHLVLNWTRYCGSAEEFESAASEIIRFTRYDVRNKIVRRFPMTMTGNRMRSLLRLRRNRQWTRAGLLERYYEQKLFGDIPLSRLPDNPRLQILSTNLSEGCLCGFNKNGMLLQRRSRGRRDRFERVRMDLATVPMAVAASSAFPGFFPPHELSGWEVGSEEEEFSRQSFTDGGVYDNLGLRMFRYMEQAGVKEVSSLRKQDFFDLDEVKAAIITASNLPEEMPLRRLRQKLEDYDPIGALRSANEPGSDITKSLIDSMSEIIRSESLHRDERFQQIELADPSAQALLTYAAESSAELDLDSRSWLNRQIIEATLRQAVGKHCLKVSRQEFDGILVSDAGGKFKVTQQAKRSGLIGTALRASDILMDRVWQLELEAFDSTPGVITIPISEVVGRSKDNTAMPVEIQRQVSNFRTDLDRFSELEISALVQHGYCVARKICRAENDFLRAEIPSDPPWKPFGNSSTPDRLAPVSPPAGGGVAGQADGALQAARELRFSSRRKIWSTLFDPTDWTSYVWFALLMVFLVGAPTLLIQANQRNRQTSAVTTAIADMNPDYRRLLELLRNGPAERLTSTPFLEVESLEPADNSGFKVISDTRILDLRGWADSDVQTPAMSYKRLTIERLASDAAGSIFRQQRMSKLDDLAILVGPPSIEYSLLRTEEANDLFQWEVALDLQRLPIGSRQDVFLRVELPEEEAVDAVDQGRFRLSVAAETGLLEVWMLLPPNRRHETFEVLSYPIGEPEKAQLVVPHTRVELALHSIATFQIIAPTPGAEYECRWTWADGFDAF